jgi:proteasome lid subunit RPN8/RPN11
MYCIGNPLKFIDPWGLDTFLIDKRGNFAKNPLVDNTNNFDVIVKVSQREVKKNAINYNKKGELRNRHKNIEVEKNSFVKRESELNTTSGNIPFTELTLKSSNNPEQGQRMYEFFVGNTEVEWSYLAFLYSWSQDVNVQIGTSHNTYSEAIGPALAQFYCNSPFPITIISLIHSHPGGDLRSSQADRDVRDLIMKYGQKTIFSIYSHGEIRDFNYDK